MDCVNRTPTDDQRWTLHWEFRVPNKYGLHLRPLQLLVNITNAYPCEIELCNSTTDPDEWINAKSIIGLTLLAGAYGHLVRVRLGGEGAEQALAAIQDLVRRKFDED